MATFPVRVSVIITTFNYGHFLSHAIESVLAQTYTDYELIVVDDGSTDDSAEVSARYGTRLTYVRKENGGIASARNRGIAESRGEFVCFLDADDTWVPEKLELQVRYMTQHPEVAVCFGDMASFDQDGEFLSSIKDRLTIHEGCIFRELLAANFVMNITTMIRSSVMKDVGPYDEDLHVAEDYNLYLRIAHDFKFGFVDRVLARRRCHSSNTCNSAAINFHDGKLNLEKIARRFPETDQSPEMRSSLDSVHKTYGLALFYASEFEAARRQLAVVLGRKPFDLQCAVYLVSSCFPRLVRLYRGRRTERGHGYRCSP